MSVERLRSGRLQVRVYRAGVKDRIPIGVCDTEEEARALETAGKKQLADSRFGITIAGWMATWLDHRELVEKVRSVGDERGVLATHVKDSTLGRTPLRLLTVDIASRWIADVRGKQTATPFGESRPISPKRVVNIVGVLKQCIDAAIPKHIETNPLTHAWKQHSKGVQRDQEDRESVDAWTFLSVAEQRALCTDERIPEAHRIMMAFPVLTGLRDGEQFSNHLHDITLEVDRPGLYVRWGNKGEPPKNGKRRFVHFFPETIALMKRWLQLLPSYCPDNPLGLIFPGPDGGHIGRGKTPLHVGRTVDAVDSKTGRKVRKPTKVFLFKEYLELVGIKRDVRWHDLRHTCGTMLVSGDWGHDPWTLRQVQEHLGHRTIKSTERYAHISPEAGARVASAMPQAVTAACKPPTRPPAPSRNPLFSRVGRQGLEPWTYGLKARDEGEEVREVESPRGQERRQSVAAEIREEAVRVLRAAAKGQPVALDMAVRFASQVLDAVDVEEGEADEGAGGGRKAAG